MEAHPPMIADNSQGLLEKRETRVTYNSAAKFGEATFFVGARPVTMPDAVRRPPLPPGPPKLVRKVLEFFLEYL
jgi:hypothetical protein